MDSTGAYDDIYKTYPYDYRYRRQYLPQVPRKVQRPPTPASSKPIETATDYSFKRHVIQDVDQQGDQYYLMPNSYKPKRQGVENTAYIHVEVPPGAAYYGDYDYSYDKSADINDADSCCNYSQYSLSSTTLKEEISEGAYQEAPFNYYMTPKSPVKSQPSCTPRELDYKKISSKSAYECVRTHNPVDFYNDQYDYYAPAEGYNYRYPEQEKIVKPESKNYAPQPYKRINSDREVQTITLKTENISTQTIAAAIEHSSSSNIPIDTTEAKQMDKRNADEIHTQLPILKKKRNPSDTRVPRLESPMRKPRMYQ